MKLISTFCVVLFSLILSSFQFNTENYIENWPNWRGPNVDGVSLKGTPPTEWSETKNVKWKTPIPGKGIGTPVVWEDQIFITTAIELDQKATKKAIKRIEKTNPAFTEVIGEPGVTENILQFVVYSISRKSGEINWEKVVREQFPHEKIHKTGSWASASCVTDGEHVIASFGSFGIYCFDMGGNLIWEKDLGDMKVYSAMGEGASPVLYKENLIIMWDHEGQSKIYVLNKKTGEEIWQKDRDEKTTWSTPIVVIIDGKVQIIVPGNNKSIGYDLASSDIIWKLSGLGLGTIPSPVFDGERVFIMNGGPLGKKMIQAVNLISAKGNLDYSSRVIWTCDNPSFIPSLLLKNGKLYFLKANRVQLSCVDAKTGKIYYDAVKPEGMVDAFASPVLANGKIYMMDRRGTCAIFKEGTEFEVIAQNKLDDNFDASPAIVGNDLLLRGHESLYCISKSR